MPLAGPASGCSGVRIQVFSPLRLLLAGSFAVEQKRIAAALALRNGGALEQAKHKG